MDQRLTGTELTQCDLRPSSLPQTVTSLPLLALVTTLTGSISPFALVFGREEHS